MFGLEIGEILQKHAKYCKSYLVKCNLTYHTLALAILNMTIGSDTCTVYNKFTVWFEIQNDADSNKKKPFLKSSSRPPNYFVFS